MTDLNLPDLMRMAVEHHGAGRLGEAEVIYRDVLARDPSDANAWHLLGMVAHAMGAWDDAAELIAHACKLQPGVWGYRHNLAEAHRAGGRHEQAAAEYEAAERIDSAQPRTHVGLGAALEALGCPKEAAGHYLRAAELDPNSAAAHYGLASALAASGSDEDLAAAAVHARRAVELLPEDADTRYRLAMLLTQSGDHPGATEHFRVAAAARPELNFHLGAALARQGSLEEAVDCFAKVIASAPDFGDAYNMAGRTLWELGRREEGIDCFRRAAALMPDRADVQHDLGLALDSTGRSEEAAAAFAEAARLGMGDEARLHLAALGQGDAPSTAPADYVRRLFDDYADQFDRSLVDTLHYGTPQLLADAIRTAVEAGGEPGEGWAIADLGCGTGLLGPLLRPIGATLLGVDLSPRMIEKARERGVYDELIVGDVVEALSIRPAAFDLITAADVFVYVGDLRPVFQAAAGSIRRGGWFAFSVELTGEPPVDAPDPDYRLTPTRRYAHSPGYISRLASEYGYAERFMNRAVLRQDKGQDVRGLIVVLQK